MTKQELETISLGGEPTVLGEGFICGKPWIFRATLWRWMFAVSQRGGKYRMLFSNGFDWEILLFERAAPREENEIMSLDEARALIEKCAAEFKEERKK